jgi:DNA-binding NarL/FixJ family response regulator
MHISSPAALFVRGMIRVLYYDRDTEWRAEAERCLSRDGEMAAVPATSFGEAAALVRSGEVDVVVADPLAEEALALLSIARSADRPLPFVLLMEPGRERIVIDALHGGADRDIEKSGAPIERLRALAGAIEQLVSG